MSTAHLKVYAKNLVLNRMLFQPQQMRDLAPVVNNAVATQPRSENRFFGTRNRLAISNEKQNFSTNLKHKPAFNSKNWKMVQIVPSRSQQSTGISVPSLLNEMLRTKQVIKRRMNNYPDYYGT